MYYTFYTVFALTQQGMKMNQTQQRASAFIHRLPGKSALKQYTRCRRKNRFLSSCRETFSSWTDADVSGVFPGMPLEQIQQLLQSILSQMTNERLLPALKRNRSEDRLFLRPVSQAAADPAEHYSGSGPQVP
jgi:hypothetical protein